MKKLNSAMGNFIKFLHIYQGVVIGAVIFLLGTVMMVATKDILSSASGLNKLDRASFFPQIILSALLVISVVHMINGLRQVKKNKTTVPSQEVLDQKAYQAIRSVTALGLLFLYVFLLNKLGFVITSIAYMIGAMTHMTKKEDRNYLLFVIISVVSTLVVYLCFKHFLYIYLPNGILKGVF